MSSKQQEPRPVTRNESTPELKSLWEVIDAAAARAPKTLQESKQQTAGQSAQGK